MLTCVAFSDHRTVFGLRTIEMVCYWINHLSVTAYHNVMLSSQSSARLLTLVTVTHPMFGGIQVITSLLYPI